MLKEVPTRAPIDRTERGGNALLLLLLVLMIASLPLAIAYLDEMLWPAFISTFLAIFSAIGILLSLLYAIGGLQPAGRAGRNDITKQIVDSSSEGHLVLDQAGRILYANAMYQSLCGGLSGREASIRPVERLVTGSSEVSEATYRLAQAAREGRSGVEVIRLVPALTGEAQYAWYQVRVRPFLRTKGDRVAHWTVLDVTRDYERNETDFQELQQAISYLDHAPAGFFSSLPDGTIAYLNATLADWLDIDLAELSDRQLVTRDIISGDGAALLGTIQGAPGSLKTETIDLDLKRRNGKTVPARLLHRVAFAADGTAGISRTLVLNRSQGQDASEGLRAAEVRLARFFNNGPLAIATINRAGIIQNSNARFAALFPPSPKRLDRDLLALAVPEDRPKLEAALADALTGRGEIEPVDAAIEGEAKRSGRFFLIADDQRDNLDEVVIVYLLDTTEEKKLQEQFFQSMKMNAIGQLAGGVAHDFNNHLQAIVGFSDLLISNYRATDPRHQDVMQIKNSANRAKSLVKQLVAFSRQQTLLPEAINLGEQLSDLSTMLKRTIGPSVELEQRHGRDLWSINADPSSFDNMIINLAVNARDAMPEGGKLLLKTENVLPGAVEAFEVEGMPAAEYVLVSVTDSGTGMPPEIREKIFEPFFTTKGVGQGTGLGLSSVYGFVKQSGGYVACESVVGMGTTFRIFLPRHIPAIEPVIPAAPAVEKAASESKVLPVDLTGQGTILLVEDEDAVRNFGARALRSRGYTVIEAQSGVDALEKIGDGIDDIHLVVSDVVMPEMDGPTLLRELRARKPDLKVVFVSGYAEEAFRKNLPDGEQFDFLAKPFSLKQLVETVKTVIG
jgi:two-component system, cell cycle sensor histidine kinase and response regulator CckA